MLLSCRKETKEIPMWQICQINKSNFVTITEEKDYFVAESSWNR